MASPMELRGTQRARGRAARTTHLEISGVRLPGLVRKSTKFGYLGTGNLSAEPVHSVAYSSSTQVQYVSTETGRIGSGKPECDSHYERVYIGPHADEYRSEMAPSRSPRRSPGFVISPVRMQKSLSIFRYRS